MVSCSQIFCKVLHIRLTNASESLRKTQMCKTASSKSVRMSCIGKFVHREHGAGILTGQTSLMPKWRIGISHKVWGMRPTRPLQKDTDRKSTRLNSSHANISYAVFCLKKKTKQQQQSQTYNVDSI